MNQMQENNLDCKEVKKNKRETNGQRRENRKERNMSNFMRRKGK